MLPAFTEALDRLRITSYGTSPASGTKHEQRARALWLAEQRYGAILTWAYCVAFKLRSTSPEAMHPVTPQYIDWLVAELGLAYAAWKPLYLEHLHTHPPKGINRN